MKYKEEFSKELFSLKTFYGKSLEIIDNFTSGYIYLRDASINHYYTVLQTLISNILSQKRFEDLKKEAPKLYDSLIGDFEIIDVTWKDQLCDTAYGFLGKIEKEYILSGPKDYKFSKEFIEFFNNTDKAINNYNKRKEETWKKMEKVSDRNAAELKDIFQQDNKISAQERPLGNKYAISVKDNKIWINEYLLSKPHATGKNYTFLEYVQLQKPNTNIERKNMSESIKEEISGIRFIKLLGNLGFVGEIKKAFFYKVGKNSLFYRGDTITSNDIEKLGINHKLFIKQLEVANIKNSPR